MSVEQAKSGGVAEVVQELTRLEQHAAQARKVLIITGDARPGLLAQLRDALVPIGIDCIEIEPRGQQEHFAALPVSERVSIQSFAELLACPDLAELMNPPPEQGAPTDWAREIDEPLLTPELVVEVPAPISYSGFLAGAAEDSPKQMLTPTPTVTAASVAKLDMTKPVNWVQGDVFTENPKFTLPHMRREWFIRDMEELGGSYAATNIEIERVNANRTELLTIEQFLRGYVFVRHADPADQ